MGLLSRISELVEWTLAVSESLSARTRMPTRGSGRSEPSAPAPAPPADPEPFFAQPDPELPDLSPYLSPGGRILDLGCGSGRHLAPLTAQGYRVLGSDRTLLGLGVGVRDEPGPGDAVRADLFQLPLQDASFDGVLAWQVLCQFPPHETRRAFAEVARILRVGGIFVLSGCYGASAWGSDGVLALGEPFEAVESLTLDPSPRWPRLRWLVVARKMAAARRR